MAIASRVNTISANESPISSTKYNDEINNIISILNLAASLFAGTTPPATPDTNQLWLDTRSTPALIRRYDGTKWKWTGLYYGATSPSDPETGCIFINSTTGAIGYWTGSAWGYIDAKGIVFDNSGTEIVAVDVEAAIKEVSVGYQTAAAAASAASASASSAASSASSAQAQAVSASGYATQASDALTGSEEAQDAAEAARDLAQKWASEVEDTPVSGGEYSAKHYAAKAAESALSAGQLWEVSGGVTRLITADVIDARSEKITNVATPTADGDAVNKGHLDSQLAGKASTAAATTSAAGLMSAADKVRLDALELAALTIASIESY